MLIHHLGWCLGYVGLVCVLIYIGLGVRLGRVIEGLVCVGTYGWVRISLHSCRG